jgi:hypothetical protein
LPVLVAFLKLVPKEQLAMVLITFLLALLEAAGVKVDPAAWPLSHEEPPAPPAPPPPAAPQ